MVTRNERDVLLDLAMRGENLVLALKFGSVYDELRGRVIVEFLAAVEEELALRLGERWSVTAVRDPADLSPKWVELLAASFLGHPGQFRVIIEGEERGLSKRIYLAARSDCGEALHDLVRSSIEANFAPGTVGNPSLWWRYLPDQYAWWGDDETTLLLHRKTDALTYVVDQLERLTRAVESALSPS